MTAPLDGVRVELRGFVERALPRIFTHACRDPGSLAYGCFDRSFWHYKVADFPSIILQQGAYALWVAGEAGLLPRSPALLELVKAGCAFWNLRAGRRGAFEEYYPFEQGYPPLAFSTLAVMKIVASGAVGHDVVASGARVAARQLLSRFERQAANQQVAGLAALAWLRRTFPSLVDGDAVRTLKARTLALQDEEGWFEEYDGPDLGYLSVALDCLWDLHDAEGGDPDYVASAERALRYMAPLVSTAHGRSIGMHNARNTDYILPYGLARFVAEGGAAAGPAASLLAALYAKVDAGHFLHAVDDRYLCHYTGHSLIRAIAVLGRAGGAPAGVAALAPPPEALFLRSGHYVRTWVGAGAGSAIVSLRKGGIATVFADGGRWAADFGWVVLAGGEQHVTHWWSKRWAWRREGDTFHVSGPLFPHRERLGAPWKHAVLRVLSFLFGRRLIDGLKRRLIFQARASPFSLERRLSVEADGLRIEDRITRLPPDARVLEAPRSSKRHVASADSFHPEDIARAQGLRREATTALEGGVFTARIALRFGRASP